MASCIFVYIICCNHAHFCFFPMTVAYVHLAMPDTEQVDTITNRDTTNTAVVTTAAPIASVVGVTLSVVCIVVLLFLLKKRKRGKEGDHTG